MTKEHNMYKNVIYKLSFLSILFTCISNVVVISQCTISDMVVTNSDCDENDKFSVEISFSFSETGMNGFQVLGNGSNYGTFQYADLPIIIEGLNGNCEIEFEFIVRDVIDPTCAAFYDYGTVCCDDVCAIDIFDFVTSECNSNFVFDIDLNLEYEFVGDNGYSVDINGEDFGNYSYEALPLSIDDITTAEVGLNTVTICDNDSPECCSTITFLNPCFCSMTNITSTIVDCNELDSTFFSVINFDHVATNDSFQMGYSNNGTNTFLGTFAYLDLPVTVGPITLSETDQEILIIDTDDFFCFNSAYLGIVDDCNVECQLFNVFAEPIMCEEGSYFMDIEFEGKDLEGSNFEILIDGLNYGTFEYGETTYSVGPIPSDCDVAPTVVIQDSEIEFCSDFFNLSDPVCCPADCIFTSLETSIECGTEMLTINGTFENDGAMLSSFYFIQFLGTVYGPLLYGDFTFSIQVPLLANGEYEITINDSQDPECNISATVVVQCEEEPCLIFDVFVEAGECEENLFSVDLEFEFAGEISDSFEIAGNGTNYGTFAYGEQFYSVGPLEGDCVTLYEFVVSDQIFEGCNSFFAFNEPVCCSSPCSISGIEIIDYNCEDELNISDFTLNFAYNNPQSNMFNLFIDGLSLGNYNYSDLPVTIEEFTSGFFTLLVRDSENGDCQSSSEFDLDCTATECSITEVVTNFIECMDDNLSYFVSLDFDSENTGTTFDLYTDGILFGSFAYAELPVNLGPLLVDTEYNFVVTDSEFESCKNEFQVYLEQCETGLDEATFDNVEILQNNSQILIVNNEIENLTIRLLSSTGAVISIKEVSNHSSNVFDTNEWPTGLYFLNMASKNHQKTTKILVY